ncbi:MAG TPA: class I SAM-dependent methyltransferase [Cyclobacteriaceae bacterium]|nr:class I SAM-dependent methyltransferase [Cyclobacteriaceae bacterium]
MIRYIIFVFKRFAWFKRLNAKFTYEILAKKIPADNWHFMNYGYVPHPREQCLRLGRVCEEQYALQMYHYLATKTDMEGKHLLEVGSGRGGGARHIAEVLKPASYTGMDIAHSAVDLANKMHALPNLKFIQGSAEHIPLADSSVDVVINVESCHAYGSVCKFFGEVKRVLKPGGYFLMADFRSSKNMAILQDQLKETGMETVVEENISDNVVRSIEASNPAKTERIRTLIPARWQKLFSEFAGVEGSRFHQTLKDGSRLYYRWVLRKC